MPRISRRAKGRRTIDPKRYRYIVYQIGVEGARGYNPFAAFLKADPPPSDEEYAQVWRQIRNDHVAYCIEHYPGERPPGFWMHDFRGRAQRGGESDLEYALEVLDMTADERERAMKGAICHA